MADVNPWSVNLKTLFRTLSADENGLSFNEASSRLKKNGPNAIPDKDRRNWLDILVSQFKSPLLLILIVSSLIAASLGEVFDTVIILSVIFISALLGFFQEYKSEKALKELKKYFTNHAVVLRGGEKLQIDARELVPGDVVFVGIGDIVPADLRILETHGISANESILTGESMLISKTDKAGSTASSSPPEILNGLFMGTTVSEGYAQCVVVSTGQETFFGKTASIFSAKVPESEFQLGIRKFGDLLIRIIFVLCFFVFIVNYLLGHGGSNAFADSLIFSLALAIGIAPEALPAVISITLSSGSLHLARKRVITKKLAAIEDLGNMDVLCTDKTGTLTEESIRMDQYVDLDLKDSHDVFRYAVLCNSAVGVVKVRGNPIDVAIRKRALQLKTDVSQVRKIQEIPFDYNRRRMGQVVNDGGRTVLIVKGAPESVLSVCTRVNMGGESFHLRKKARQLNRMLAGFAKDGHSSIAVAYKRIKPKKEYSKEDEADLVLIGFILFTNPPKPGLHQTLDRLGKLNIKLKIVTGDDGHVTRKLCERIGFRPSSERIVLGREIRKMNHAEFLRAVEEYSVFARVTPDQKLAIVEALRANGHVVGFLGDGINDAPALRTADVGISVNSASDVAKGASHIILLQKSLGVVCDGVSEGRAIFGNITKYILNTMSANNGNMITVAVSSLFLPFLPLLPSQILLNNLLSDIPLMSIASDNVDKSQTRRPRKWDVQGILRFMLFFGAISTVFDLLLIGIMYLVLHTDESVFRTAWFLESVLSEMLIVFSLRTRLPFFKSMPAPLLVATSMAAAVVSFAFVYLAPLASLFYFVPLTPDLLLLIGGVLVCYFIVTEVAKTFFFPNAMKEELEARAA